MARGIARFAALSNRLGRGAALSIDRDNFCSFLRALPCGLVSSRPASGRKKGGLEHDRRSLVALEDVYFAHTELRHLVRQTIEIFALLHMRMAI